MERFLIFCLLTVWFSFRVQPVFGHAPTVPAQTAESAVPTYDLAGFTAELHRLSGVLDKHPSTSEMAALRDSLPKHWALTTPESTYSISTQPLRNQLTALSAEKAKLWVDNLAREIENSSAAPAANSNDARIKLDGILARSEFAAVRPPSAWELFRQRFAAWFERLLLKFFRAIGRHPIGGQILFWLILIGGVLAIALWLFRFISSRDRLASMPSSEIVGAARSWQEWIRAAREAANRGDFREAVHSAYWAGIVRLEDSGVVPRDRTKTPREYLRLVTQPAPGELMSLPAHREPLSALTLRLERVWYAHRAAGAEDYHESLRQLEALGCPLE